MTKNFLAALMEWLRPIGIGVVVFAAFYFYDDPVGQFHVIGPFVVMLMSGTVAFESLFLGEVASEKIGYAPNRAYQVQSALANAAVAATAALVYVLGWGLHADATVVIVMLMFFTLSGANHLMSAIKGRNMKPVNLLRPIMALLLNLFLIPLLWAALAR